MAKAALTVTVLMGGTSPERDVSLASGSAVGEALRANGHRVRELELPKDVLRALRWNLPQSTRGRRIGAPRWSKAADAQFVETLIAMCDKSDVVFVALHGGDGEDGKIQAVLEMAGICYTGAGSEGCGVAFNKGIAKAMMRAARVPTADWLVVRRGERIPGDAAKGDFPKIVKPSKGGSTIGVSLVQCSEELETGVAAAFVKNDEVLIEDYVDGRELTVGILGGLPLPVVEIVHPGKIFDYGAKYIPGMAQEICPARLSPATARAVQAMAVSAHLAVKLDRCDYSRVDCRLTAASEPYCLEVNVLPGMTPASLMRLAGRTAGIGFPALCQRIIELSVERRKGAS
jgi:D-alanine-D-alanine ligase